MGRGPGKGPGRTLPRSHPINRLMYDSWANGVVCLYPNLLREGCKTMRCPVFKAFKRRKRKRGREGVERE